MAERRGTGGRGGLGNLGEGWAAVPEQAVITRMRSEPSPLLEAIRGLLANLGQSVERTVPGDDGQVVPVTYSKSEAQELVKEARRAASQLKLSQRRLSLRITTDPSPLDEAPDDAKVRVQFKVERRKPAEAAAPEAPASV